MAGYNKSSFSPLRLTSDDEKRFTDWIKAESVDALDCLKRLTGDGFKVTMTYVFDQNAWCVSLVGTETTKKHKDVVMTSWSDDLGEAIAIGAYKHYIVCDGGEWPSADTTLRWG